MSGKEFKENPAAFIEPFQSICMGSVDEEGTPHASYAPFAADDRHRFYVLLSGLATHSSNLYRTGLVSVMFIEDENTAGQLFARRRLTLDCSAELLDDSHVEKDEGLKVMKAKFGESVERMSSLPDFRLFRLTPKSGKLVLGFGQAYTISADLKVVEHERGDGAGSAHGVKREL